MNTKFNIGDRVSYISSVAGDKTVFQITQIRIYKDIVEYQGADDFKDYYSEDILTLYTKPKKKVIKYLWAYQSIARSVYGVTYNFYADESEFKEDYSTGSMDFFKRLDWSATEFEVES